MYAKMMKFLKSLMFFTITLAFNTSATAENRNEEDAIINVFSAYMEAYSNYDFYKAATFIHPQQLRDYKEYTLPVLVAAKNNPRSVRHPIVDLFFEKIPDNTLHELTGIQVSANLDRAWATYLPAIIDSARLENITIESVVLLDESSAKIKYSLSHNGEEKSLEENFARYDGNWRILLPIPPKQAAEELQAIFE